jgi:hydrogenase expression/formation protein HypD
MKYLHEYRNPRAIRGALKAIKSRVTRPWNIMEICGGQTHGIVKYGLDQALDGYIHFIHGPGCPVCVTPESKIDAACLMALQHKVILCSYGDMLRVPGQSWDLLQAKAAGADVRLVHEPMEALALARAHPDRELVFFAVGFETTAPVHAMMIHAAAEIGLNNFSVLLSHVLVPPALRFVLDEPQCAVEGILAAGHVCVVTGYQDYEDLARDYARPIVVTGFEALDILEGVLLCVELLETGSVRVTNQYQRAVSETGNLSAMAMVQDVFRVSDVSWRGLGPLPGSGLTLQKKYEAFDAERRFPTVHARQRFTAVDPEQHFPVLDAKNHFPTQTDSAPCCPAGDVLKGKLHPLHCPYFGKGCSPDQPLGAPMVSSEGACMAYFQARSP